MAESTIDYRAVFRTLPGVLVLLTPDGVILDVNEGFLDAVGRELGQVLGRSLFDAFPANPADPGDQGQVQLRSSFERVVASGERDVMPPIRYDVEDPAGRGTTRSVTGPSSTRRCGALTAG